jgi:hypothetical protein
MESAAELALRALHRQMYADLIRAYLRDYGTQKDLARALGTSEAYVSFLLEPLRGPEMSRRSAHWSSVLTAPEREIVEAFKFLKTPSEERARQIADQLCTDIRLRDFLRQHIDLARTSAVGARKALADISGDQIQAALMTIGNTHQIALFGSDAVASRDAYLNVWDRAARLAEVIDAVRNPAEYAQTLMYLHDAAQVFNRPDLALGHARKAVLALPSPDARRVPEVVGRLRINALLAEAVSLNTLGLPAEAMAVMNHAAHDPEYQHEPESWLRSFLEQQLTAFKRSRRISIYRAERVADRAISLVPADDILQAGITRKLLDVYVSHATARSRRKAHQLAMQLWASTPANGSISPLRRTQILVSLHRYFRSINDSEVATECFMECMLTTKQANLFHQQRELLTSMANGLFHVCH